MQNSYSELIDRSELHRQCFDFETTVVRRHEYRGHDVKIVIVAISRFAFLIDDGEPNNLQSHIPYRRDSLQSILDARKFIDAQYHRQSAN